MDIDYKNQDCIYQELMTMGTNENDRVKLGEGSRTKTDELLVSGFLKVDYPILW